VTLVKIKGIRCSPDIPIGLEIALDCVFDSKYPYEHKEAIFSTPKQAFGEFRPGFEGVTQDCFNVDTYASAYWKGSSTNRRRVKSGNQKEIFMRNKRSRKNRELTRRDFIKTSVPILSGLGAATLASGTSRIFAAGSDKVRIGLIGCGGRGIHDTTKCLNSAENVELVAMGDLFKDRLDRCRRTLKRNLSDKVKVTEDTCFVGWDAYKKVLGCDDVDMVILTQPPHFRPGHLKAAIETGKHVFMEKPVAVDPVGVRSVIASSELADRKGLTIGAGTQMRRISHLVEGIKSIHDGAIGEIVGGQCVRSSGGMLGWGQKERQPNWSDMEWQLRRLLFPVRHD
jgi:hypothetical protein